MRVRVTTPASREAARTPLPRVAPMDAIGKPRTSRPSSTPRLSRPRRRLRRHRRAIPPAGVPALLPLRRQPRGRQRSGAGRLHPRVSRTARFPSAVVAGHMALSDRGERQPQSHGAQDAANRGAGSSRAPRLGSELPDTTLLRAERAAEVRDRDCAAPAETACDADPARLSRAAAPRDRGHPRQLGRSA